ncbi:hypothetical protein ACLOJK_003241 [Asimina triloba]
MKPAERLFLAVMGIPSEEPAEAEPIVLEWSGFAGAPNGETPIAATRTVPSSSSVNRQGLFKAHIFFFFSSPYGEDASATGVLRYVEFWHQRKKVSFERN